jgi:hypothetical protein
MIKILNKNIYISDWVFSGFVTLWVMSIMETLGLLDSNIREPLSNCMMFGGGLYICYRQCSPNDKIILNNKAVMFDNMLHAFSNEMKKVVDEFKVDIPPNPPNSPTVSIQPYTDEYIKTQVEFLTRITKETDAIENNIRSMNSVCADYESTENNISGSSLVENDTLIQPLVIEGGIYGFSLEDNDTLIQPLVERGMIGSSLEDQPFVVERGRSRTYSFDHGSLEVNRRECMSRSRSRELCKHQMVRYTVGYDDRCKKCNLCGYEVSL